MVDFDDRTDLPFGLIPFSGFRIPAFGLLSYKGLSNL